MDIRILVLTFRWLLAALWLVAALGKLHDPKRFVDDVQEYGILPRKVAATWGRLLPYIELLLGVLLFAGVATRLAAAITCLLLCIFAGAMIVALRQGRRIRCHCFGELGQAPVSWTAIGRNLLLAACATAVAVKPDGAWSLPGLWASKPVSIPQPSLNEVLPLWFIMAAVLAVIQAGFTLYQVQRVAAGRHPDETMRF